ncbi:MAG: GNAT family N-acetyltransferase [Steroidobacteraceae bacterium]|nr:GNAT family N-acetyltransferase [Steroidobacteraceae bacterium]
MLICESERLRLRELVPQSDADFILRLLNDPSFLANIGDRGVRTRAEAERYIETGPVACYERFGYGLLAVELKHSGVPIGLCGLLKRTWLMLPDIGFAYLPEFWGKGYAFEAASAVLSWARDHRDITELCAITAPDNRGSIRVLEKLGFAFERVVRSPEGQQSRLFRCSIPPVSRTRR